MKRVNLIDYFDLSEQMGIAKGACSSESAKAGSIYFGINGLSERLAAFVADDNGFSTSKHPARELAQDIRIWINSYVMDGGSPNRFDIQKFDTETHDWQYSHIARKVDEFRNVFTAECRDVEVYSVGQVSIYRTASLVANGSHRVAPEYRASVPESALDEFDNAGKCLAFDLPTACGFHALRGVELMILKYLEAFGTKTDGLKTWHDYVKAVDDAEEDGRKPSKKVGQMLDRMRDLDRNPLMHPRDTLDTTQADMLFSLAAITVVEMARDLQQQDGEIVSLPVPASKPKPAAEPAHEGEAVGIRRDGGKKEAKG